MSRVFTISDLHFSHKNMAIRRGFKDETEQDEHIIESWNSVVNKKDTVYCLGDICMERSDPYKLLDRLNGIINVVLGNHDYKNHVPELLKHVNSVAGMIDYKGFILTHCPIHPCQLEHRYNKNIHGHVHSNSIDDSRYINVCCEVIDYKPILISSLC